MVSGPSGQPGQILLRQRADLGRTTGAVGVGHRGVLAPEVFQLVPMPIAFFPDGKLLAGSLRDGSTIVMDLPSRQPLGNSFAIEGGVVTGSLFTAQGNLLIDYVGTATDWPIDLGSWECYACQVAGRDITPAEWASVLAERPYEHVCPS